MKNCLILFVVITSLSMQAAFASTLPQVQELKLTYGHHMKDEIHFMKQKKNWKVTFFDRGFSRSENIERRIFPNDLAEEKLLELEYFLKINAGKLQVSSSCFRKVSLWVKSKGNKALTKQYCLENLTKAEWLPLSNWIRTTTALFRY